MLYRIEMERVNKHRHIIDNYIHEMIENAVGVKTFLKECVPDGYQVKEIIKMTKDGKGYDVTVKYIKEC